MKVIRFDGRRLVVIIGKPGRQIPVEPAFGREPVFAKPYEFMRAGSVGGRG